MVLGGTRKIPGTSNCRLYATSQSICFYSKSRVNRAVGITPHRVTVLTQLIWLWAVPHSGYAPIHQILSSVPTARKACGTRSCPGIICNYISGVTRPPLETWEHPHILQLRAEDCIPSHESHSLPESQLLAAALLNTYLFIGYIGTEGEVGLE